MDFLDNQLIESAISGDEKAFAAMVERYAAGVYQFAYRYVRNAPDAEDVVQETFVRAWKNLKKFDTAKNLKTWLFTIAKNVSLDLLKKKRPVAFSRIAEVEHELESLLAPYIASGEVPEENLDKQFLKEELDGVLAKLPVAYRAVLALRYKDFLKFREIAKELGEPLDTVKSRHRRGLAMLRAILVS